MAFYNLKKKPALTTKEGETETMYADIVYSGTIPAERLIRGVAKRTGFKEGVIEGILMELKDDILQDEFLQIVSVPLTRSVKIDTLSTLQISANTYTHTLGSTEIHPVESYGFRTNIILICD